MDHQTAIELLNDYIDGELSASQEQQLDKHLKGCESCTRELEELRQTLDIMGSLRKVAPPDQFVGKVQQRINKRSRGRFFGRQERVLKRIPFEWISFVIIIIMLVLYLMTVSQQPSIKPAPVPGKTQKIGDGVKKLKKPNDKPRNIPQRTKSP